ncbi:MAG: hypothetical protein WCO44_09275 [Bacteroidota bacterium]
MSILRNRSHVNGLLLQILILGILIFFVTGCRKPDSIELYHKFPDKTWARFNLLSFEIPVKNIEKPYDVILFVRFTPQFAYEKLGFNMVMNTPDGEERINQYDMNVKSKSGTFLGESCQDSCQQTIILKKELHISKAGVLKIEIENLTPRLITEGVMGVGIRMVQSGK